MEETETEEPEEEFELEAIHRVNVHVDTHIEIGSLQPSVVSFSFAWSWSMMLFPYDFESKQGVRRVTKVGIITNSSSSGRVKMSTSTRIGAMDLQRVGDHLRFGLRSRTRTLRDRREKPS
jgi:hypothetical protein